MKAPLSRSRYEEQRQHRTPPHASVKALRIAAGYTIDQLIARMSPYLEDGETPPTKGAISGIENGHRGPSSRMIQLLESAYGLPSGSIVTDYVPRERAVA